MNRSLTDLIDGSQDAVREYRRLQQLGAINLRDDFYPSILYPPMNFYPSFTAEQLYDGLRPPTDGLYNVYAHVPFCLRQCTFCHIPVKLGANRQEKARYVETLAREMDLVMQRLGVTRIPTRAVLLGGGTPTDFPPDLLDELLTRFTERLDLSRCTQISVDLDPTTLLGTAGAERLAILRRHGVSRLAFGVQSLDDAVLQHMHRAHNAAGVEEAVGRARAAGMSTNVEFIFGYLGQTLQTWAQSLQRAMDMQVDEVQIYRLKVIPYRERAGVITTMETRDFPGVEDTLRMQHLGTRLLEQGGYRENMRRFFTRTPQDYSHYFLNWTTHLQDQLGFGQTAFHSFSDRYGQNTRDVALYEAELGAGRLPVDRGMIRDEETQIRWAFSLPLRYFEATPEVFTGATGLSLSEVFVDRVARLVDEGLVERTPRGLRLTWWGSFFCDEVIQLFHDPRYLVVPTDAFVDGPLHPLRDNAPRGGTGAR
ncbi:radical SAM protein [Myxococcota bacterium]|nr:radical SAM protein [Myxococcota bacterium]